MMLEARTYASSTESAAACALPTHVLHRDIETRSTVSLKKVGAHKYAADATTEVLCVAYAVDDQPVQLWLPGDPVPPEFLEASSGSELGCVLRTTTLSKAPSSSTCWRRARLADHSARAPPLHDGGVPRRLGCRRG